MSAPGYNIAKSFWKLVSICIAVIVIVAFITEMLWE